MIDQETTVPKWDHFNHTIKNARITLVSYWPFKHKIW